MSLEIKERSMERQFDENLRNLKFTILKMGGYVEKALQCASEALLDWNEKLLEEVPPLERQINKLHRDIDEICVQILATQSLVARDLRFVVATMKINSDLERMGDQSMNIAQNSVRYLKGEPLKKLEDLPLMSEKVREMLRASLNCVVNPSETEARNILQKDDEVDNLKNKIFKDVTAIMKMNPQNIEQGLNLILISRNLEKIGDHACNIAEDVIFVLTGEDVRHPSLKNVT